MKYKKGQQVAVKDCDGRNVLLRVWEEKAGVIFVASDNVFQSLERGDTAVWAIGVPRKDVSPAKKRSPKK
jgi:hypothetical protein